MKGWKEKELRFFGKIPVGGDQVMDRNWLQPEMVIHSNRGHMKDSSRHNRNSAEIARRQQATAPDQAR